MEDEGLDAGKKSSFRKSDFEFGDELGEGAYGRVIKATLKSTGEEFAVKVVNKALIVKLNKVKSVMAEKDILNRVKHPNIVELKCTFQDDENVYFVLELCTKGEIFHYLKYGPCSLEAAQFYSAEVVSALEYLHSVNVIHRDLKPENILVTSTMHLKLTDFGTAKTVEGTEGERATFVGTPQYVAPETLEDSITSAASDLWSLGCVIFQMLSGHPPFDGESEYLIFQKILNAKYEFPPDFPETGKDLIQKLLVVDPKARLGVSNYEELKNHAFFEGIEWDKLSTMTPPKLRENMDDMGIGEDDDEGMGSLESKWERFLMENEKIVHTGLIVKRRKMTSKKRQLVLTDFPRIFYVDPERMVQMGEIPWSDGLWVQVKNDRKFIVHTPNRKYDLESLDDQAMMWANEINGIKTSLKD